MANTGHGSPSVPSSLEDYKLDDQGGDTLDLDQLIVSLPKEKSFGLVDDIVWYRNFWCPINALPGVLSFCNQFKALDSDVIVASYPKSCTTWLKALTFSILHRIEFPPTGYNHPLTTSNPHKLVPSVEYTALGKAGWQPDLAGVSTTSPRLFGTHIPHDSLPESIHLSGSRVLYICRNPLDVLVSLWHFVEGFWPEGDKFPREEHFDRFCSGIQIFGPLWDHILGYWKASLVRPDKVLFLKYEGLKEDIAGNLKRIAEFLGVPFSVEEEREGVVDEIAKLCSLSNLKELEVNKTGEPAIFFIQNNMYFRKGEIGDWKNHLTPFMAKKLESLIEEKLSPFGLKVGSK